MRVGRHVVLLVVSNRAGVDGFIAVTEAANRLGCYGQLPIEWCGRTRFFGVYRVMGQRPAEEVPLPHHLSYLTAIDPVAWAKPGQVWYDLVKVGAFEELEHRVVIDWGLGARSWAQWATLDHDKRVIRM